MVPLDDDPPEVPLEELLPEVPLEDEPVALVAELLLEPLEVDDNDEVLELDPLEPDEVVDDAPLLPVVALAELELPLDEPAFELEQPANANRNAAATNCAGRAEAKSDEVMSPSLGGRRLRCKCCGLRAPR
ncbi:MAG: hypothetical protein JST54_03860 [Deltaproteobacteria bacterium]|nr:hypothetical protein [Deltaproteobacteria bacterium]